MPTLQPAHDVLRFIVELAMLLFEYAGVIILVATGIMSIISYVRRDPFTRLNLARGLAMGLEFKLGSEILRTVIVRDLSEVTIVGAIILLRAALSFLINWEIKTEEAAHLTSVNEKNADTLHVSHKWRKQRDKAINDKKA